MINVNNLFKINEKLNNSINIIKEQKTNVFLSLINKYSIILNLKIIICFYLHE